MTYPVVKIPTDPTLTVPPPLPITCVAAPGFVLTHSGKVIPSQNPLADAIRNVGPGGVIGVFGDLGSGASIGTAADPFKPDAAVWGEFKYVDTSGGLSIPGHWVGGTPVHDITIQGMGPGARIRGLAFGNSLGGAYNITIRDVIVQTAAPNVATPLIVNQGSAIGFLALLNVTFAGYPDAWGPGFETKWNMRAHGQCQLLMVNCKGASASEHALLYADNLQGASRIHGCTWGKCGRTGIQVVNRQISGPPSFGDLYLTSLHFSGEHNGDGGSLITVCGHGGDVYMRDIDLQPKGMELGAGIAVWADEDPAKGLILDADGYATQRVFMDMVNVQCPQAPSAAAIAVSGQRELVMGNVTAHGSPWTLWLNSPFSSPLAKTGPLHLIIGSVQKVDPEIRWGGDKNSAPLADLAALVKASAPVVGGTGGQK